MTPSRCVTPRGGWLRNTRASLAEEIRGPRQAAWEKNVASPFPRLPCSAHTRQKKGNGPTSRTVEAWARPACIDLGSHRGRRRVDLAGTRGCNVRHRTCRLRSRACDQNNSNEKHCRASHGCTPEHANLVSRRRRGKSFCLNCATQNIAFIFFCPTRTNKMWGEAAPLTQF